MKKVFVVFLAMLLIFSVGCTNNNESNETDVPEDKIVKFYFPLGVPSLTVSKLAKENPVIDENITIVYELQQTPDLIVSKVLKSEADIAIVPSNLVAQLYNKDIPYKLVGTSTWGTLYLVGLEDIDTIEDLKGKEIHSFGKNLTPDLVFKYILSENNIDTDNDITINYLNSAAEVGPQFISGKANLAVLSEPQTTNIMMKKEDAKVILDFNKEWSNITGIEYGYPQASLIISNDLIENNREFVDSFLEIYEDSLKWIKENPELAGEYIEELGYGMTKDMVVNGIERMNIYPFKIEDSIDAYEKYFEVLMDFAPDVIGGKLPDEELYFER